ncbi:MAG TPA: energy-coupling factor transporter transmembrane component T [Candidatus Krumholzibacteria bacterium]|nr:energy-coupling factor transporter transmembrane component T [Candidatus Krumholzibacteria bacterium]
MLSDANVVPAARWKPSDPRALLFSVLLVVVASVVLVQALPAMLGLFVFVMIWYAAAARRPGGVFAILRRILPFAAVILVLNALLVPGEALVRIAGHRIISVPGTRDGAFFALRVGVMLMSVSLLLAATDPESLARGVYDLLRRLSPSLASRVAFFTFLSMGFVPLFADEIRRVRIAQSFRGGELKGGMLSRAGSLRMWLVPVLMSAVRRSGDLALAVELRDTRHRLVDSIPAPRARAIDFAWLTLVTGVVVVVSRYR